MTKKYIAIALSLTIFCIDAVEYKKKKVSVSSKKWIAAESIVWGGLAAVWVASVGFIIKVMGDDEHKWAPGNTNVADMSSFELSCLQSSKRLYSFADKINTYGIALAGLAVGVLTIKKAYNNCFEVQYNCAVDCINQIKKNPLLKNNYKMRKKLIKVYNALYSFSKSTAFNKQYRLDAIAILQDLKKLIVLRAIT